MGRNGQHSQHAKAVTADDLLAAAERREAFVGTGRLLIRPTLHRHLLLPGPSLSKGGQPPLLTQERFAYSTVFAAGNTKSCEQHPPAMVPQPRTKVQSLSHAVHPFSRHI